MINNTSLDYFVNITQTTKKIENPQLFLLLNEKTGQILLITKHSHRTL